MQPTTKLTHTNSYKPTHTAHKSEATANCTRTNSNRNRLAKNLASFNARAHNYSRRSKPQRVNTTPKLQTTRQVTRQTPMNVKATIIHGNTNTLVTANNN
eukprot:gene3329-2311_t